MHIKNNKGGITQTNYIEHLLSTVRSRCTANRSQIWKFVLKYTFFVYNSFISGSEGYVHTLLEEKLYSSITINLKS